MQSIKQTENQAEEMEKEVSKKYKGRDKKKRPKMKVSGKSVIRLKRLMNEKDQKD